MLPNRKNLRESPESPPSSLWFRGACDFGKNMGIIIAALLLAVALSSTAGALIRCHVRRRNRRRHSDAALEMPAAGHSAVPPTEVIPAVVFSAGEILPVVGAADCAICLLEFAAGDTVRILPNCGHGFHVRCIDVWISSQQSCPTCRKSSLPQPEMLATDGV
ncbi:RING-H2 finger protein ATL74-like [Dendrobium catenatum]|uniref:RING-H2 finger protein ATL72 n=1 Tax=Dendrobium catenatum TaxID=906689 RepID=A0A2I0WQU4_9ASPA|nr:RING-H2 finger protein ATL74-like [Dendrobium catenatum]PKU78035.1 RING-H2 finger protein ATL72 [Dendrobium catenatum]